MYLINIPTTSIRFESDRLIVSIYIDTHRTRMAIVLIVKAYNIIISKYSIHMKKIVCITSSFVYDLKTRLNKPNDF